MLVATFRYELKNLNLLVLCLTWKESVDNIQGNKNYASPLSVMGEVYYFPRRQLIYSFSRLGVSYSIRKVFESTF